MINITEKHLSGEALFSEGNLKKIILCKKCFKISDNNKNICVLCAGKTQIDKAKNGETGLLIDFAYEHIYEFGNYVLEVSND